jgi:hypothetical protein
VRTSVHVCISLQRSFSDFFFVVPLKYASSVCLAAFRCAGRSRHVLACSNMAGHTLVRTEGKCSCFSEGENVQLPISDGENHSQPWKCSVADILRGKPLSAVKMFSCRYLTGKTTLSLEKHVWSSTHTNVTELKNCKSSKVLRPIFGPWPSRLPGFRDNWVFTKWGCSLTPNPPT